MDADQHETIVNRPADPMIGSLCGNFRILRQLGSGGMGVVYEAEHHQIGRRAVVKVLHGEYAHSREYATRFLNEARSVNIIRHPGLVEIFDFGQRPDGTLFIVMEFLDGQTLSERYVARGEKPALSCALHLGLQVSRALVSAHSRNIVHRDLKPENIMLVSDPVHPGETRVKILDFGIAKVALHTASPAAQGGETGVGAFMGTPKYMAPEQFGSAETVDGRADVFSLGVILYALLAGKPAYEDTPFALVYTPPPLLASLRPDLPPGLSALVKTMMAVEPSERPTMLAVSEQLAVWIAPARGLGRSRLLLLGGVAAVVCLAGVAVAVRLTGPPSLPEARRAALAVVEGSLKARSEAQRLSALAAVSQSRDGTLHELIQPLLTDPKSSVSAATARTLGEIGALAAISDLKPLLSATNPRLQLESASALARLSQPSGPKVLRELLGNSDSLIQVEAALRLLELGDLTGSALLNRLTSARSGLDARTLVIVGALARAGEPEARKQLVAQLQTAAASPLLTQLAFALARLGDGPARTQLEALASNKGASQLLAARLLASLGDPRGYALLGDVAGSSQQSEPARAIAVDGLGDCGDPAATPVLFKLLGERGISSRLRLLAAGAILQVAAGDPGLLAEQTLAWTRTALSSDSTATRELAATLLGDLETNQSVIALTQALRDREREVRRSAAKSLGRQNVRQALAALTQVLDDADDEVRAIAMRSIGRVSAALIQGGDKDVAKLVSDRLRQLTQAGAEHDRVAAAGTLLQLGDRSQRALVIAGLSSRNPLVRRLAVEVLDADAPILRPALTDKDRLVRLVAARRLTALGHREAVPVLRELVAAGDLEALTAYGILKRMGEDVPPPPDLGSLLQTSSLPDRYAITEILGSLPPVLAYQMLLLAVQDPASVIRRHAAAVAVAMWKQTRQPAFLGILRGLVHDPEVAVREAVNQLLRGLPAPAAKLPVPADPVDREPEQNSAATDFSANRGRLIVLGESGVRVQIDRRTAQAIGDRPLPVALAAGKHHLDYVGGQQDVTVAASQTVTVRIPAGLVEQLLQDTQEALQNGEVNRAQALLERCRRLVQSSLAKPQIQGDLIFLNARLNEIKEQFQDALTDYNRYLRLPRAMQRPESLKQVQAAVARLGSRPASAKDAAPVFARVDAAYAKGKYAKAIQLARTVQSFNPTKAFRIIGAAACKMKNTSLANEALGHLDATSRQYVVYFCQSNNIVNGKLKNSKPAARQDK